MLKGEGVVQKENKTRKLIFSWGRLMVLLFLVAFFISTQSIDFPALRQKAEKDFQLSKHADEILIPTLGVRAQVFEAASWKDEDINPLLQKGVALLPTDGWLTGEHFVLTAHSSGTVSMGDQRFIFSTLPELKPGDKILFWHKGTLNEYSVKEKNIVVPTEIDKLPNGNSPTLTLVSCWPIGQNSHRILVMAEKS